jgi:hypothetical protein
MPKINIQRFNRMDDNDVAAVAADNNVAAAVVNNDDNDVDEVDNEVDFSALSASGFKREKEMIKQSEETKEMTAAMIKKMDKAKERQTVLEEKERIRADQQQKKMQEKAMKEALKKQNKVVATNNNDDDNNSIFGDTPTPIIGKTRRQLLTKINQYKSLFKDELKGFKIKKNANEKELEDTVNEIEDILSTGNVDAFLLEGVLTSIRMIENVSAMTQKYNVSGMADLLKANPEFHKNAKLLFVKYGCYSNVPPEAQMLFIIATTAIICRQKNLNKQSMNAFLDARIG